MRAVLTAATTVALLGFLAAPAGAATQIGQTFTPTDNCSPRVRIQTVSPGNQYAVPFAGVITSWSFERSASAGEGPTSLRIARAAGGDNFAIIGESTGQNPLVGFNTYTTRIPVQAGDLLGLYTAPASVFYCARTAAGYTVGQGTFGMDFTTGMTAAFPPFGTPTQLDVSATLEPDCDSDGFGDETQDPEIPATQACDPDAPDTTITGQPKDKTKKKQATFEFTSTEAGSSFECSLDGGAFEACSSPDSLKVKKGKHSFEVRAKDAAGNVDGSPAVDDWKVKKKRK